ncbi:MAG: hypothetical protein AAF704_12600 [Cyanobacteria bacterium P01_D01_bin.123]
MRVPFPAAKMATAKGFAIASCPAVIPVLALLATPHLMGFLFRDNGHAHLHQTLAIARDALLALHFQKGSAPIVT